MDCIHSNTNNIIPIITIVISIVLAILALLQYSKNSEYTRMANLSSLWRKFYDKKEENSFLELFTALDELVNDDGKIEKDKEEILKKFSKVDKLRYLAYLAEIVSYTKIGSVDKEHAKYLFHWHFYYVFINTDTKLCFWEILGGKGEHDLASWGDDELFARDCEKYMYDKGILKKD